MLMPMEVVMMRRGRWRRCGVTQLDRLAVRRVEIRLAPSLLALGDLDGRRRALEAHDGLERGQPLPVVSSVGGLAGLLWMGLDLGAEHFDPLAPGEEALAAQVDGAGEGLC